MTTLAFPTASSGNLMATDRTIVPNDKVAHVLSDFTQWLAHYGELSRDHQTFFAGTTGRAAKRLYYNNKLLGTAAVAPMIFLEAFFPSARRFFHHPTRFPIADAHYAMGFAFLYQTTGDPSQLENAIHFLTELQKSRCHQFKEYCWGYPFDWVTRNGVLKKQTPLITTTPYVYEAFLQVDELLQSETEIRGQRSDRNCLTSTSKFSNRLRDTPLLISRISRPRKRRAVVPTLLTIGAVLLTLRLIAPFC